MDNDSRRQDTSHSRDEDQSLAQIREIVFGDHRRQTDQQLAAIDTRINEQDAAIRQLLDQRFEQALDELNIALDALDARHRAAIDALGATLQGDLAGSEERNAQRDSEHREAVGELRQRLDQQATRLKQLENDAVDRLRLADLLEAMALQLRQGNA